MRYIVILLLLIALPCFASPPTRSYTYTAGETILSDEVTTNEDNIYNYLTAGVDTIKDEVILNADISGSANIQSSKINLTAVDTVTITSQLTMSSTTSMGWEIGASGNQACNTTCTNACVFGFDDGLNTLVACTNATADKCVCAGEE